MSDAQSNPFAIPAGAAEAINAAIAQRGAIPFGTCYRSFYVHGVAMRGAEMRMNTGSRTRGGRWFWMTSAQARQLHAIATAVAA